MSFFRLLLLSLALTTVTARAGTLRIALLADTQVQGDTVLLANFFPPGTPLSVRAAVQAVSLGLAPQIGSVRRFSRDFVSAVLQDAGFSQGMFLLPEILTAHRAGRTLTRDEVFAAIQSALAKNPSARLPQFQAEDLAFQSDIEVPEGTAGLEVTQLSFDPALARARFRIWPHASRGTLPFIVTARTPAEHSDATTSSASRPVTSKYPASLPSIGPVLVDPRQIARLHLHSQNLEMLLAVRPLQPGHLDETIRVRLAASGRTFRARVVALNYLDAVF
jgi:hypothetical protein